MTVDRKSGLLPRIVGGAKQKAEGMVRKVLSLLLSLVLLPISIPSLIMRTILSYLLSLSNTYLSILRSMSTTLSSWIHTLSTTLVSMVLFLPNLYIHACTNLAASLAAQGTSKVLAARETVTRTLESAPATVVAAKTRELVHNIVAGVLTTALVFSLSIFLYATFYHAYMPIEVHEERVNLQFLPCDTKPALCSFPNATLPLKRSLMSGQAYSIALLLEVPDSPINQGLGMLLSCLSVLGADGEAAKSCRSSILEYRSELLRAIDTLVLAPFHLMGLLTQRQWVRVPFFLDFQDNPSSPATELQLELQSKFIQIYSAKMEIHAQLSGLRHIMYHHPWISSLTGILANISTLTLILLISWAKLTTTSSTSTTSSAPQKHVSRPERQVSESSEEEVTILDKPDGKEDTIETV